MNVVNSVSAQPMTKGKITAPKVFNKLKTYGGATAGAIGGGVLGLAKGGIKSIYHVGRVAGNALQGKFQQAGKHLGYAVNAPLSQGFLGAQKGFSVGKAGFTKQQVSDALSNAGYKIKNTGIGLKYGLANAGRDFGAKVKESGFFSAIGKGVEAALKGGEKGFKSDKLKVDVCKGDGNCFYRAVSKAKHGHDGQYRQIRREAVVELEKHLKTDPETNLAVLQETWDHRKVPTPQTIAQAIDLHSRNKFFADDHIVGAATQKFKTNFVVVSKGEDGKLVIKNGKPELKYKTTVFLDYDGIHYNLLRDQNGKAEFNYKKANDIISSFDIINSNRPSKFQAMFSKLLGKTSNRIAPSELTQGSPSTPSKVQVTEASSRIRDLDLLQKYFPEHSPESIRDILLQTANFEQAQSFLIRPSNTASMSRRHTSINESGTPEQRLRKLINMHGNKFDPKFVEHVFRNEGTSLLKADAFLNRLPVR